MFWLVDAFYIEQNLTNEKKATFGLHALHIWSLCVTFIGDTMKTNQ